MNATKLNRRSLVALTAAAAAATHVGFNAKSAGAQDSITVTMVTDTAGLGDQNFNDLTHAGLQQAAAQFGVTAEVIESLDPAQYGPNLTAAAEQGEMVVATGFLLVEDVGTVADQYPDVKFLLIDAEVLGDNVQSVLYREHEAGFLSGICAALATKTGRLGIVGGQRIPPVIRYEVGFVAGVRTINPAYADAIAIAYVDSFGDAPKGKEFALAQFQEGVDITFPIAGATGSGCYEAAKELGPQYLVIGADTDQEHLAPGQQLCVAKKGLDTAVIRAVRSLVEGNFQAGTQNLGLAEDGVGFDKPGPMVTEDQLAIVNGYAELIKSGGLTPPADDDQLAAFTPVFATPVPVASPDASPEATPA